ncbi:MAG: DNA topoisomerase IV subunit A [Phycisphaerales bacterium]|jgi:DNA topoisomerase-6 subunit A|nr:DNA topoisomerase IV subunit A [Phycisphaerales bacterium]
MAKKKPAKKKTTAKKKATRKKSTAPVSKERDKVTTRSIELLADSIARDGLKGKEPHVDIPLRTVTNMKWNKKKRILEMGDSTQTRSLFNAGQARKFMQTLLLAKGSRELIKAEKTLSLRGMYYMSLHTIEGTKEKTFNEQSESDTILEDLEVSLGGLREELHVFAKKRGTMVGNITVIDNGDEINCRRMGTGGYAIPSICEPSVMQFKDCGADFVLHVEKDTVWSRFNEDRFWETHNCILTEGSGQPPRGVRRLLHRLNTELGLPVYCLLDCDPWGHYIYSVIKQGSINLAFESQRMAIPDAKFIGIRAEDYERCELSPDVRIALNERDITRAQQIADYPWFKDKRPWQKEIKKLLANGFKMEVESLITKDISYVTEEYVPARLKAKDFLD